MLLAAAPVSAGDCVPSETRLCLLGGRFAATLEWDDGAGSPREALVSLSSGGTRSAAGVFRFYASDPSNWEILVKMIDACAESGRRWVLVSASTGFGWRLRIADQASGETRTWSHPLDGEATGIADFEAFAASCDAIEPTPTPAPSATPGVPAAQVRYWNDWYCAGQSSASFASELTTGDTSWLSFSRRPSRWRDWEAATIGPFVETNPTPCGGSPLYRVFTLERGRRYSLFFDGANELRRLTLLDEGLVPAEARR